MTGHEAIELAETDTTVQLNKYNDPTEVAREDISIDDARGVAKEDPGLIFAVRRAAIASAPEIEQELTRLRAKLAASEASRAELVEALEDCADWLSRSTRTDDLEIASDARAALANARKAEGREE